MVSRLVRENHVKAVLSGEGADECFLGYPWLIFNVREFLLGASTSVRSAYRLLNHVMRRALGRSGVEPPAADSASIASGLLNPFETDLDDDEVRADSRRKNGREPTSHELVTLSQLGYHLRTLLHRNDCLGMAASIEARFPFLDTALVRLAVNMPYNTKVRFAPSARHPDHLFLRDKWVLRKVAERSFLNRSHTARRSISSAPARPHPHCPNVRQGFIVSRLFGLDSRQADHLFRHAGQDLKIKILHLEVWSRLFLDGSARRRVYVAQGDRDLADGAVIGRMMSRLFRNALTAIQHPSIGIDYFMWKTGEAIGRSLPSCTARSIRVFALPRFPISVPPGQPRPGIAGGHHDPEPCVTPPGIRRYRGEFWRLDSRAGCGSSQCPGLLLRAHTTHLCDASQQY